jgi:hypothetical protein
MSITPVDNNDSSAWERAVRRAVESLRYGSVEVQVHDGRVVQVETREKIRFTEESRPVNRRLQQDNDGRAHRNGGGAAPSVEETNE